MALSLQHLGGSHVRSVFRLLAGGRVGSPITHTNILELNFSEGHHDKPCSDVPKHFGT